MSLLGERILAIGAHADDIELGCGGTLARAVREGSEVFALTLSKHDPWFDGTDHDVAREWDASLDALGVPGPNRELHSFLGCRDDDFQRRRAEVLEIVERARDAFRPDCVLFHASTDTNQDHRQVHEEVVRALKRHATLLGYEFPNNQLTFEGRAFVTLEEQDVERKKTALAGYDSLREQWNERTARYELDTVSYLDPLSIESLASVRGLQAGARWAECFEVLRILS